MDRLQDIERSIIKTYRAKLWSQFVKALKEYDMLKPNDHICVCISGGKDSMLLAKLFQELKRHSDFEFDVTYMVMNPGYNQKNFDLIMHNLEVLNIDAKIIKTDIFEIADILGGKPCYMCAKMRRGALYKYAKEFGCNKIALGHHFDDVIETTMMSILNNGQLETMLPKLKSDNYEGMELIRPMYLIRERDIINWAKRGELEFIQCACKLTEGVKNYEMTSQRKETKKLLAEFEKQNPIIIKNIFKVTSNVNMNKILGWKKDGKMHSFLDDYEK